MKAQACDMYLWTVWQIYSTLHTLQDNWLNCSKSLHQLSSHKLLSTVCIVDCYQWRSPLPNTDMTITLFYGSASPRSVFILLFRLSPDFQRDSFVGKGLGAWMAVVGCSSCMGGHVGEMCSSCLNTLRPRRNWRHFADDIFKYIHLNENALISIKIPLKFIPKTPINNMPALFR